MAARGSQFSRIIAYFKTADVEEVRYVLQRGGEILTDREQAEQDRPPQAAAPKARRGRRARGITGATLASAPPALAGASLPAGTSAE